MFGVSSTVGSSQQISLKEALTSRNVLVIPHRTLANFKNPFSHLGPTIQPLLYSEILTLVRPL
jgi:hypothetical protein